MRYEFLELGHPDNPAQDKDGGGAGHNVPGGARGADGEDQGDSLSEILH